jgi:hypothetical protein
MSYFYFSFLLLFCSLWLFYFFSRSRILDSYDIHISPIDIPVGSVLNVDGLYVRVHDTEAVEPRRNSPNYRFYLYTHRLKPDEAAVYEVMES